MDGKTMKQVLIGILNELTDSSFLTDFFTCEMLDAAASDFVRETKGIAKTATITTDTDQQEYNLPPGFIECAARDSKKRSMARYYDNVNSIYYWPYLKSYDYLWQANRANLTGSRNAPDYFSITDATLQAQISTNAISSSALAGEEVRVVGSNGVFENVHARARVHDVDNSTYGIVLEVESSSSLKVALFDSLGAAATAQISGSVVIVQPEFEKKIVLSDPSETAGHTIVLPYYGLQDPVYSSYRVWPFKPSACHGIIKKAAFNYKYRDEEPNFGDRFYLDYTREVNQTKRDIAKQVLQGLSGRGYS